MKLLDTCRQWDAGLSDTVWHVGAHLEAGRSLALCPGLPLWRQGPTIWASRELDLEQLGLELMPLSVTRITSSGLTCCATTPALIVLLQNTAFLALFSLKDISG